LSPKPASAPARELVLIGSGEMGPRMARVERGVIGRLAAGRALDPAALRVAVIDTPYAFQANAEVLSAAALDYFSRRLNVTAEIAAYRRADNPLDRERTVAAIRAADIVFSGPGSPSYALRHWSDGPFSELLTDKFTSGGALIAASAAALTLGRFTAPIYEMYKAGADPHWLPGLDVLAAVDLDVAVIPHFDNAEGGTHDTRYCFIGERRLLTLEHELPAETAILGIDEHTALVIDAAADRASVHGRGSVTLRRRGASAVFESGSTFKLSELRVTGAAHRRPRAPERSASTSDLAVLSQRIVQLEANLAAARERAQLVEPLILQLLDIRRMARDMEQYEAADAIRDRLVELGIEVKDSAAGTDFVVA
jgi:cyanophycinase-like exopeptidase